MAPDVGRDVHLSDLRVLLDQFERGEDGPFGTAGAKSRRTLGNRGAEQFGGIGLVVRDRLGDGGDGRKVDALGHRAFDELCKTVHHHLRLIFAGLGEDVLAHDRRIQIRFPERRVQRLFEVIGEAFLNDAD